MESRLGLVGTRLIAFSIIAGLAGTAPSWAQGPQQHGGPGGPPPGGMGGHWGGPGRPGGPGGNFRPNAKMRLSDSFAGLADLEKSKTPLTRAQARQVLLLLQPWQKKSAMSEGDAQSLLAKLTALLTAPQQNAWHKLMASHRPPGFRPGGPGGPGGPPPGGPGGHGGPDGQGGPPRHGAGGPPPGMGQRPGGPPDRARMQQMQTFFKTYNPFYAPAASAAMKSMPPPMRERWKQRSQATAALMTHLAQKSK